MAQCHPSSQAFPQSPPLPLLTAISPFSCGTASPTQVETTLNLLRALRVDPTKSAYEVLNGPYDWNRYPLAPLGCKAGVYKDGNTRGSWASRGVDAFYSGPAKDHYRCDIYYVPETRAYQISGSTELFPQHCQLPSLTQHQHFRALTEELTENTNVAGVTLKG
jgi:hypothetical protein